MNWAEDNLAAISHLTGLTLPTAHREFYVILNVSTTSVTAKALATNVIRGRWFTQKLMLSVSTGTPPPEVNRMLCTQILNGMAWRPDATPGSREKFQSATAIPDWLIDGICRNLNFQYRCMDQSICIELWQNGKIASLAHVLKPSAHVQPGPAPEVIGFFMNWIFSQTNHSDIIQTAFQEIRKNRPIDMMWLAGLVTGCSNAPALEETWERWVQKQRQGVNRPGVTSEATIERLQSCLVIYAGMNGVPRLHSANSRISLVELAAFYREPWVGTLCDEKCVTLRLIALGQSQAFVDTTELYCKFFQAIKLGTGPRTLQEMLQSAHDSLMRLDQTQATVGYSVSSDSTESPKTTPGLNVGQTPITLIPTPTR